MRIQPDQIDRARGALVGLACGDAVGTTLEFKAPGSFEPIRDMVGGGPFSLEPGQWTDDTSMALCLAASLLARDGCDPVDQLNRYVQWRDDGYMAATGQCRDIGNTVNAALEHFQRTNAADSGSRDESASGNGALMRLAPVVLFNIGDPEAARRDAIVATITTHGSMLCQQASEVFAALLHALLSGRDRAELLSREGMQNLMQDRELDPRIMAVIEGSFRDKEPPEIRGTGFVVASLEAALWAFHHAVDFEDGALRAANLGDDADTTAAIYGQLAGAYFGLSGIPTHWRERLQNAQVMIDMADALVMRLSSAVLLEAKQLCQLLVADPEHGVLLGLLDLRDGTLGINNYSDFTQSWHYSRIPDAMTGLVELAAGATWFSRAEHLCWGAFGGHVSSGDIPRHFDNMGNRLRDLRDFMEVGALVPEWMREQPFCKFSSPF
ncbi:ADP-ribosylglycohydrolase family protein [Spectribacter hydrogenoxidans]|uniref:ADP-ribosylglycohydrolase family protein n=1 Tax=Spectribacter hydrogenoxidans TaxID=3075608 RepID=A0ABU3C408_9GAMM|nr:ADP-ribosylglycohydrolase family protein [Salinisphaera sp. W335]MDT0636298.1 ADP-ribosylglycohydrolase family protein [Salinisphaera sp. W335]